MISDWEQRMIEDDGQTLNFDRKSAEGQFERNKVTDEHLLRLCSNPDIDFTKVKKVDLRNCSEITDQGVVALIDKFGDNLEWLNLWDVNKITNTTLKKISIKCQHLKTLVLNNCTNISDDGLQSLSRMSNPSAFEKLQLYNCNKISHQGIISIIETFPQLKLLNVGECTLLTNETFRVIVEGLPNLTWLCVYDIGLTVLPEDIGDRLPELEVLYLHSNKFTMIPRSISKLNKLSFSVSNNPLQEPPLAIAEEGVKAISRYFKELDKGADTSNKLKVVLIGDGEAGKTTLLQTLEGLSNPRTHISKRTIHLSLKRVQIPDVSKLDPTLHNSNDNNDNNNNNDNNKKAKLSSLDLNFYDCGGQEEYLPGQAPFLTNSALYLLVVSAKETNEYNFIRFLVLLQARAPRAIVQIVITKCDMISDPEAKEQWVRENIEKFNKLCNSNGYSRYASLRIQDEILKISIKEKKELGLFDNSNKKVRKVVLGKIVDILSQSPPLIPSVGQVIPKSWNHFYDFVDVVTELGLSDKEKLIQAMEEKPPTTNTTNENICQGIDECVGVPRIISTICDIFSKLLSTICDIFSKLLGGSKENVVLSDPPQHLASSQPYVKVKKLFQAWKDYSELNATRGNDKSEDNDGQSEKQSNTLSTGTFFLNDALNLLEAQGGIYMYDGVVFLKPQFITDLMVPLVDHQLAEKVCENERELHGDINNFLSNIGKPNEHEYLKESLKESLETFVRTGAFGVASLNDLDENNLLLRFLWRNVKKLDPTDYASIVRMLQDCGIIFMSSFLEQGSRSHSPKGHPVVLYRLPIEPVDKDLLNETWPDQCPSNETHFEVRVKLPIGCPPSLSINFSASAHSLGNCSHAWLNGALVTMKDNTLVRVELVEGKATNTCDYLRFGIRAPTAPKGISVTDHLALLSGVYDFMEREKEYRLPGLAHTVTWACPKCIARGNNNKVSTFAWPSPSELDALKPFRSPPLKLDAMKPFCKCCSKTIDIMDIVNESTIVRDIDQANIFSLYNDAKMDLQIVQIKKKDLPYKSLLKYCSDDSNISNLSSFKDFEEEYVPIPVEKTINIAFFNNEKFEVELLNSNGTLRASHWVNVPSHRFKKIILGPDTLPAASRQEAISRLEGLESGQQRIESKVDDIPSLFLDMENIKCPYMFKFVTKTKFVEEIKGAYNLNNADETTQEQISRKIDKIQNLLDSTKDFVDVYSQDDGADKKGDDSRRVTNISNKLFGKKKVVYLVLYCGRTFNPMVCYKVENTIYNEKAKALAKVGATMCTLGIKASIVLNTAGTVISAFGYPLSINIDSDSIEKVKSFLDNINDDENDESNAFVGKQDGGLKTPKELDDFHALLNDLEKNNKIRQLGPQTDKTKLKGKSWSDALVKADVTMKDGKKFITFVDKSLETGRLGYMKSEVEG